MKIRKNYSTGSGGANGVESSILELKMELEEVKWSKGEVLVKQR